MKSVCMDDDEDKLYYILVFIGSKDNVRSKLVHDSL